MTDSIMIEPRVRSRTFLARLKTLGIRAPLHSIELKEGLRGVRRVDRVATRSRVHRPKRTPRKCP